jgi:DNA-binding transcriptional ArsR family regulator
MEPDRYTGLRLDATAVKVLAHPLRSRLLGRLRTYGPATATDLASALSTNTGATSYHLRKLEAVGLVTDTGEGEGRRRLWRASTEYHAWSPSQFRDDEDAATAAGWLERDYVRQQAERAEQWLGVADTWPAEWADALGLNDTFVTVTPEQLRALRRDLDAVVARYRHAGDGDPGARRIALTDFARPVDLEPPVDPDPGQQDQP